MYDILKKKDQEAKKSNDMIIANLTNTSTQGQARKMPLNESYSYFIVQKTINKDRKIIRKYPHSGDGKFST